MVQTLGPHCNGIVLQLPAVDHMLDPLGNRVGIISLPFDMLEYGEQNGHARMMRLSRTCHLRKMKVWIEDVPDNAISMKLAADGVDMVTLLR